MQQRTLGSSGLSVSAIGLGGMYLSIDGRPDEAQGVRAIHASLDAGVTLVDTANVYCLSDEDIGHNERLIAKALASWSGAKDAVVVATKGGLRRPEGRWTRDGRPAALVSACDASLAALGVERIGVYQLHAPDDKVRFEDSVGALAKLREAGKIAHVGLSNVTAAQVEAARAIVPIVSVQNRWSPFFREVESNGVLAYCVKESIAFLPYSPFGGANRAKQLGDVRSLAAVAKKQGVSPHRLVLAWMLSRAKVVIPIPGGRREETVRDSAGAADFAWSEAVEKDMEIALRTM